MKDARGTVMVLVFVVGFGLPLSIYPAYRHYVAAHHPECFAVSTAVVAKRYPSVPWLPRTLVCAFPPDREFAQVCEAVDIICEKQSTDTGLGRFCLDHGERESYHYHVLTTNYDTWKTTAPENDGPSYETPCPVCTGDRSAPPCGEDCDRIVKKALAKRRIAGLYETAKRALHLAKMYRELMYPPQETDRRIDECLQRVDECRADIKVWRDFVEGREAA